MPLLPPAFSNEETEVERSYGENKDLNQICLTINLTSFSCIAMFTCCAPGKEGHLAQLFSNLSLCWESF